VFRDDVPSSPADLDPSCGLGGRNLEAELAQVLVLNRSPSMKPLEHLTARISSSSIGAWPGIC